MNGHGDMENFPVQNGYSEDKVRVMEISEAIHELDSKLRELEIALNMGAFAKKD